MKVIGVGLWKAKESRISFVNVKETESEIWRHVACGYGFFSVVSGIESAKRKSIYFWIETAKMAEFQIVAWSVI